MIKKIINLFNILFISLILYGCYATKTISYDDSSIIRKDSLLLHQNGNLYELRNFKFTGEVLIGTLVYFDRPRLDKRDTPFWLQVFIDPNYVLKTDNDTSNSVTIPYNAINKIEKTRLRVEYALLGIPAVIILFYTVMFLTMIHGGG